MLYPLCFVSRIRRKAGGPVSQPFYIINKLWDVKERTHCSQRVGHVVPGVVVYLDLCRRRSGWVRCDHNGLKRLPEAPLICWRPISPLWFLRNSALGCKGGNWHHSSIYLSIYHSSSETPEKECKVSKRKANTDNRLDTAISVIFWHSWSSDTGKAKYLRTLNISNASANMLFSMTELSFIYSFYVNRN